MIRGVFYKRHHFPAISKQSLSGMWASEYDQDSQPASRSSKACIGSIINSAKLNNYALASIYKYC
jgi:hypothetical protein